MKNKVAFFAILGLIAVCTACDNDNGNDPVTCTCPNGTIHTDAECACNAKGYDCTCTYQDDPKPQTATITVAGDVNIAVKGTFTNAEWKGVAGKIETVINDDFYALPEPVQIMKKGTLANCEAIFVEKTSEYTNWKTTGDGKTIYINFDILDSAELKGKVANAFASMQVNGAAKDGVGYLCTCPIGTLHLEDAPCCEGVNCDCIVVIITEGATVDGGSAAALQKIEESFQYIVDAGYTSHATYAKNNIKIMRIVPGNSFASVVEENGKWVAVIGDQAVNYSGYLDIIGGAIWDFVEANM
jgi:hypothetical protein